MAASADQATGTRTASLIDWLRSRSDSQLAVLLRRRPDLALPAPADLPTLANRLSVRTSVQRVVDGLDAFTLRVLEGLTLSGGADPSELLGPVDADDLARAIGDLLDLVLIWGERDDLHLAATVPDALGTYPAGLGRPAHLLFRAAADAQLTPVLRSLGLPSASQPRAGQAITAVLTDPDRLRALLDAADPAEREVLDRLAAGPPIGTVREASSAPGDVVAPPHRLVARGLLIAIDAQTVELPREVGIALRPFPLAPLEIHEPTLATTSRDAAELDRVGTTAVLEVLRLVAALADSWTSHPPAQLRAGGVGIRELRRTATRLGIEESDTALIAEVSAAAGLINVTHGIEPAYLPTVEYDVWLAKEPSARWADLALAWLGMTRQPVLVNQRGERDRLIAALSPDVERGTIPVLRQQILDVLGGLPAGAAPSDRHTVLRTLAWRAPRRANGQRSSVEAVLAEADYLGITAAGGLTGYSRTLLSGSRTVAEQVLAEALPVPVDHFLVQPDLTVVVPGPPTPALAAELALAADLESTGGASVYRLTEASIRRALDAGRSAADLSALIHVRSRTPIPQALQYLIDDLARRHGALRSGAASSYLRCDDELLLSRVLSDRDLAVLQLRRIAPTVVISSAPVPRVLDVLREAGYAPAAEAPDGQLVSLDIELPRAPSRPAVRAIRSRVVVESAAQLDDLVRRIRAGDALTELSRRVNPIAQQVPGVTSAATMGVLREAIREGRRVLIGYADTDGITSRHTILPISMAGGFVRGHEADRPGLQAFSLHRLTAVTLIADAEDDDPS